jgi:putative phosphoribosyl transferase
MQTFEGQVTAVTIAAGSVTLDGELRVPPRPHGLVLFAHGSGSSRHSPRNQRVAEALHDVGLATLLFDLLSPGEEPDHAYNARLRFDIALLAQRLRLATQWARRHPETAELLIGYFGASTGAAAALVAAAAENAGVGAVVARGGRVDLAEDAIEDLRAPTMLIVGGNDETIAALNLESWARLRCEKSIEIIPGAGHLFEEPGALDNVAALAARWFSEHLR